MKKHPVHCTMSAMIQREWRHYLDCMWLKNLVISFFDRMRNSGKHIYLGVLWQMHFLVVAPFWPLLVWLLALEVHCSASAVLASLILLGMSNTIYLYITDSSLPCYRILKNCIEMIAKFCDVKIVWSYIWQVMKWWPGLLNYCCIFFSSKINVWNVQ